MKSPIQQITNSKVGCIASSRCIASVTSPWLVANAVEQAKGEAMV